MGPSLSVGTQSNLNYQGDTFIWMLGGQGTPRLESATNVEDASARADIVSPSPTGNAPGQALSFATLRLPVPGCWTLKVSVGSAVLDYTLYAYPSDCRPQHERFAAVPGVTPLPCVRR